MMRYMYFDVMGWEVIKSIVPSEAAILEQQLDAVGIDVDGFCVAMYIEDWTMTPFESDNAEQVISQIEAAWDNLTAAFTEATTVDGTALTLQPDCDDEDEACFLINGVHVLTPAGAAFADKIEKRPFIVYD